MSRHRVRALAALAVVGALAGCGGAETEAGDEALLTVYVSAPLSGPARAEGQAVADGARLALADAGGEAGGLEVRAAYLDIAGRNETRFDPVTAAANARTATEDSTTIAYIGELDSGASRSSLPITNSAGILQVAPGSGAEDLVREAPFNDDVPTEVQTSGRRTFARLVPTYRAGRRPPEMALSGTEAARSFADRFAVEYARKPSVPAALGYEAMASVLAAIDRADNPADRGFVIDAYFDGTERDSSLGRYRITNTGEFVVVGE